jgi:peptidoglycan/LPS O-acetylase OafA/YrhL
MSKTDSVNSKQHYASLDGLRGYSAVGIVLMHVLANGSYDMTGFVFERLIPSFADLVFLFMVISGFSLCCGYFEKIVRGQISLEQFYSKRFARVWPFFALLCVLDLAISPSAGALYETLANLTLCFGLIPNANISVIGVGWFIGLVFAFYFLFPFVCCLLSDKKRAWLSVAVAILLNFLCDGYFHAGRSSIAYSAVFFLAGGMIYLYREPLGRLANRFGWLLLAGVAGLLGVYYFLTQTPVVLLLMATLISVYGLRPLRGKISVLRNPVVKVLSDLSMEIYLCHMVIYRVLEKTGVVHLFGAGVLSYVVTAAATLAGAALFSAAVKMLLSHLGRWLRRVK